MPHPSSLQRKPFWAPVGLAALSALAAALVMALLAWLLVTAKSTTVIVVRNAETASENAAAAASDGAAETAAGAAALSSEGRARAELLARMFGGARPKDRVDAIYVSSAPAAQATARPLAGRLGIEPVVVAPESPRTWARRVLREHRGGRILVVAGADAARDLAAELSGVEDIPPILPTEFGAMFIVTVPRIGRANLLSVDYQEPGS